MKKRLFGLLLVVLIGTVLAGCGCFQQAVKGETAPAPAPAVQAPPPPPPPPACPPCPPEKVCPPEKECPPCAPAKKARN